MKAQQPASPPGLDRRSVLVSGLASLGGLAVFGTRGSAWPQATGGPQSEEAPILVVIQLAGGNDGLNTIVPYRNDHYYAARQELMVPSDSVLPIDDERGFNPLLPGLHDVWNRGDLAIVEGVGYPSPNRSHFASFDIWHTADLRGKLGGYGWLARLATMLRQGDERDTNLAVHVGDSLPYSLYDPEAISACFREADQYKWDQNGAAICEAVARATRNSQAGMSQLSKTFLNARESSSTVRKAVAQYAPRVTYPSSRLGYSLSVCAALIQSGTGARILSVELGGFDTHGGQEARHSYLLKKLDGAVAAFLADLRGTPAGDRTSVLIFSEFGRRVAENGSGGTDHGTAGLTFVAGAGVRGGLYGSPPSLEPDALDDGDLVFNTDFRSVYATLVQDWMKCDAEKLLGEPFPTLPLFA